MFTHYSFKMCLKGNKSALMLHAERYIGDRYRSCAVKDQATTRWRSPGVTKSGSLQLRRARSDPPIARERSGWPKSSPEGREAVGGASAEERETEEEEPGWIMAS